jgi:DHA1 family tetracycline resistance protein-like MFS transporter
VSVKLIAQSESGCGISKPAPLLTNLLLIFMVAMVLANISGNMIDPLLPLYLKELDASVVQVGLFFTLSQIIPLGLQILGGWISDSLGRLRSIAIGSTAGLISYVAFILAPTWQWVLLGVGLSAITRALVAPSFNAFIAEQSSEENRAKVFGITETIFMLVSVIGPPLGGILVSRYGFRLMLICAGVLYSLATFLRIAMARFAVRNQTVQYQALSFSNLKSNLGAMLGLVCAGSLITWILVTDGIRDVAYALSFNLLPIYLQEIGNLNVTQIGFLEAIFGAFMMITTMPAGLLADKKGERIGIALGFGLQFVSLLVFTKVNNFIGFGSAWALLGIGIGLMSPAYNSLVSKVVPEKLRGTAFGLFGTSLGIVSLPAPALGALLWERVGPGVPFMITAWMGLLAIVLVWVKFKLPSQ